MNTFPKDFIWGTACASYQCEGAWNEDGKGRNIWDDFCHSPGHVAKGDTGDLACDSYHRFEEDFAIARSIGAQVHRFSVSWARIQPQGTGPVNEKGLDFYDRMVDDLLNKGITPWMTLYHWDLPSALQEAGGWLSRATVDAFADYADILGRRFGDRIRCFMPVNEPQCIATLGYGAGIHAPGLKLSNTEVARAMHHLALAHSGATRALRASVSGPIQIGTVTCGRLCSPMEPDEISEQAAWDATFRLGDGCVHDWAFTHNIYLDSIFFRKYDDSAPEFLRAFADTIPASDWEQMEKPDFMGLNVYNGPQTDREGREVPYGPGYPRTAIGWPITPDIMYYGTRHLYRRYGLPIIITEDGLSCNDHVYLDGKVHDADRIDFLTRYLRRLRDSISSGTPIQGYLHWSLLDNFEWADGYDQRFGLVHVDYATLKRTPKDSALWYKEVIASNGGIL